ncbi:MAG TPA: LysR family transcriptional regulator [Caulobacteraceae bacterium]|nr:LysR family transcriptional regulator [Caulobacteraceae bacterium]
MIKGVVRRKSEWSDIRVFWAVAQLGSFGAAARALGVGLTTVTRTVERLEKGLNAKLFVRSPQGVSLTEAGALAYDRALSMERLAEQLEGELADCEKTPEGKVKLAAPDGVAGIFLTPFLAEFVRANPKIDLQIDCGLWRDRPLVGEADLVLTFEEPRDPDVVPISLAMFHYALFASREYLDLYGVPSTIEEMTSCAYIHHVGQNHHRETWKPNYAAFQDFVHKRIETNSSAVSFNAIRRGAGIGPMPTAILSLDPGLVMLESSVQVSVRLWLVRRRSAGGSARERRVIDWLKEIFDPRTKPWYRDEFLHPSEFLADLPGVNEPASKGVSPAQGRPPILQRSVTR